MPSVLSRPALPPLSWVCLVVWLALSAGLVRLETYDGLDSILNARYFTGQIPTYTATRGPLVGLLLTPAEWIRQAAGWHPLEFRPHHAVMAVVHFLFLFYSFQLLRARYGSSPATRLAFLAAVPTFVVLTYLPFVTHDLFPGVLLLGMVVLAARFMERPDAETWWTLAALGAAAALTKHVLGLFWLVLLLALLPSLRQVPARRPYLLLCGAAVLAALVAWTVMGLSLAGIFPETPWWGRAAEQLRYLSGPAHDKSRPEPWWVYARNLPAFGLLALMLVPAGLWRAWKGTPDQRLAARTWILLVLALHLLPLRQVRYAACLGPLTAYLIQPVLAGCAQRKWHWRAATALLVLECLPLHPYSRFAEASRIFQPFHREDVLRWFLAPVETETGHLRTPVYIQWRMLSFAPPRESPLRGDIYHDLFHVGSHHLFYLYGMSPGEMIFVDDGQADALPATGRSGSLILSRPGILIHRTGWNERGTDHLGELQQTAITLGP